MFILSSLPDDAKRESSGLGLGSLKTSNRLNSKSLDP